MSKKEKQAHRKSSKHLDVLFWVLDAVLFMAGFAANIYFSQIPLPVRAAFWVVLICILILVAFQTTQGKQFWKFCKDARSEVRKVVWPTRQETFQTTLLILAIVVVFAVIMWGFDAMIMWIMARLTGQGV